MAQKEQLISAMTPTYGWLSPEGAFYPCQLNYSDNDNLTDMGNNHVRSARHIIVHYYNENPNDGKFSSRFDGWQLYLYEQGWIRTDIEMLSGDPELTTQAQIDTLQILRAKKSFRPGFPYDHVDAYLQEIEDARNIMKMEPLKVPGRGTE